MDINGDIMKNEDYCTYEQSVLLKEIGFDWECRYGYYVFADMPELRFGTMVFANHCMGLDMQVYYAPTLAQAAKWLREVKYIEVNSTYDTITKSGWFYYQNDLKNRDFGDISSFFDDGFYSSYEQALSAGIDKAIEILSNKQNDNKN